MTIKQLAEYCRQAEIGRPELAARAAIRACGQAQAGLLESLKSYAKLADEDVDDFLSKHAWCYQVRVPRLGEFWMAPLSAWDQLPADAAVISPRGLKALAVAIAKEAEGA